MFLSIVIVVKNQSNTLERLLHEISSVAQKIACDYELIVVDNGSQDHSIKILRDLTLEDGLPNLQVFALTKTVPSDTAFWVGCEHSLGDYIAIIDPLNDDIDFLPTMIESAGIGVDIVQAHNQHKPSHTLLYRFSFKLFQILYKFFSRVDITKDAPHFQLLSRRVINFILQHPQPSVTYRYLPTSSGFSRTLLSYSSKNTSAEVKRLSHSIEQAVRLLVSTTQAPMRMVTVLSLFGAGANLIYSLYVVAIAILKPNIAPGWVSLSLQQSGMFFLISLVLLVLGEYILQIASLSSEGPRYHIAQEFTSATMMHNHKLNIEEATTQQDTARSARRIVDE